METYFLASISRDFDFGRSNNARNIQDSRYGSKYATVAKDSKQNRRVMGGRSEVRLLIFAFRGVTPDELIVMLDFPGWLIYEGSG